jgi:hypothetical protein
MIRLFLILDNCDEFNKTQLYIMNENSLDTSNFNQLNKSEYLLETNEISKNSDNYEQSKSEKLQNTSIISYLTDLEHTESKANTVFLSTDYSTNKDLQIESDDNTENIEIPKGSNYTDKQILESNTQSLEKSTYYNTDIFKEFSSYSSNLIKDIPTINFKSEIIDQESSNVNKELTDHNKEQLTNYNSEIAEKESEFNSIMTGKIFDFNSHISTKKNFDSEKLDNIDNSTNAITGVITNFFESEILITDKKETYLSNNLDFIISPEKCLCGENLSYVLLKSNECVNYFKSGINSPNGL